MPIAPFIPAIISAGGAIAGSAIAKKKSSQQKAMENLQIQLTNQAAQRHQQLQPVHDSILRAYSAMLSPQGTDTNAAMLKALPSSTQPGNYYDNPGGESWWGAPQVPGVTPVQRRPPRGGY